MQEPVSIIIPTRNRKESLAKCLASLRAQEGVFEIIVVDDASTDATPELLAAQPVKNFRVITNDARLGKSKARNRGAKAAHYDLIAFIDDDCTAHPSWLLELRKGFAAAVDFVIGETRYVADEYRGAFPERVVQNRRAVWPSAGNIAYRREVFLKLGGFNGKYDRLNNEDSELGIRAISCGYHFARRPEARVYHQKSMWDVPSLLAAARNASAMVHMKKLYPQHYQTFRRQFAFGFILRPMHYVYLLLAPLLIPLLFLRYLLTGQRAIAIFFVKWPLYFVVERVWIWTTAGELRVLVL